MDEMSYRAMIAALVGGLAVAAGFNTVDSRAQVLGLLQRAHVGGALTKTQVVGQPITQGKITAATSNPAFNVLTGQWSGTASAFDSSGMPLGDTLVSASFTLDQSGNTLTAVVVFTNLGDVPEIYTEVVQINGTTITLPVTSDGQAVNVSLTSSTDGRDCQGGTGALLTMSGTGTDFVGA